MQASNDMRTKKQVTIKMTEQFGDDLNLVMRTYGLTDLSYVVRQSVAAQAAAIRKGSTEADPIKGV